MERPVKTHDLKVNIENYEALWERKKNSEYRINDRDYKAGDILLLRPYVTDKKVYLNSHSFISARVTHVSYGGTFGIPKKYCVLSIQIIFMQP